MEHNFIEQRIVDTLNQNYMPYAMSVIVSRAIPEIDGLKPSHRKLLYTMYKMGLLKGNKTKSANVVGQTMKLNPHGDMAIYETLVRLTTGNGSLLHPLIESKGNMGKCYSRDMRYAAPRYTEVKLDKFCEEMFRDIDKNTVDFVDNYDGTMREPILLPATFPNILVNPNQGIAVGMASNICAFNLIEVCNATIALIKNQEAELLQYLLAPDLPTGGEIIVDEKQLEQIYETGRGSFSVRAKYKYDKANNCIEVYEIPYTTTSEAIIDTIVTLIKAGRIKEITDIRDETDLKGLKITLDIKKSTDVESLMQKLYKFTPLQDSFGCNFNILVKSQPKVMGVKEVITEWTDFRIDCIRRQTQFDITKKSEKLHLLLGLKKILLDIDKAIRIIRNTEQETMVIPNLVKGFDIDTIQAEYIAEIRLRNLNKEYIVNRTSEIDNLQKEIADLKDLYSNNTRIKDLIISQLEGIKKKYGVERKTDIVHSHTIEEITQETLIEDYNLKLFLTEHNYLKKIPLISLRSANDHKLKEEDAILQEIETHNKADLLLFSNKYTVYKIKIYEIEDCKTSSLGEYLSNILQLDEDEKIIYITATDNYLGWMLFGFENGKMSKITLKSYATKTNRKKLANAYSALSQLVFIKYIEKDIELAAFSSISKVLIFNSDNINEKSSRDSQGVQVLRAKKGSIMSEIKEIEALEFADLDYYRTKNIPATGCYLKEEDNPDKQLSFL